MLLAYHSIDMEPAVFDHHYLLEKARANATTALKNHELQLPSVKETLLLKQQGQRFGHASALGAKIVTQVDQNSIPDHPVARLIAKSGKLASIRHTLQTWIRIRRKWLVYWQQARHVASTNRAVWVGAYACAGTALTLLQAIAFVVIFVAVS